jgi:putative ABC transport system ATP-binding protein
MNNILAFNDLTFCYEDGGKKRVILDQLSYKFEEGKFYTILGPSGSGKSTLLALACALDEPESGHVSFRGKNIKDIGFTSYRRDYISIIFQKYNLINHLTGVENVESDLMITKKKVKDMRSLGYKVLNMVGIVRSKADRLVKKLSGGEQQRVAIARAISKDTKLILADEPTGALDSETEDEVISIFKKMTKEYNKTVIVVTHSNEVASKSDVTLRLKKGKLIEDGQG